MHKRLNIKYNKRRGLRATRAQDAEAARLQGAEAGRASEAKRHFGLGQLVFALTGLTLVCGYVLATCAVNTKAASSQVAVRVSSSCSMSGSIVEEAGVPLEHTVTMINGQYQDNIGKTKLTTFCNDTTGYSIYAVGYSNDTQGNTNMLGSTTGLTIATGTANATSGGDVSNWAMKLAKDTDSYQAGNLSIVNGYDDYNVVPDTYTKVAAYTSNTDATIGSSVFTTYAAKIASNQAADTYVGKVRYTMIHPNTTMATGLPFDLVFEKYGKERDATTGYYKMQDMTSTICSEVAVATGTTDATTQQTKLVDVRDGKTYWVAKLKDGKCWMTQNLDFDVEGPLTSETTNLTQYDGDLTAEEAATNHKVYTAANGYSQEGDVITWTPAAVGYTLHTDKTKTGTNGEINYGENAGKANSWGNSYTAPHSVDVGIMYQTNTYFQSSICNDVDYSTGCNFLNSAREYAFNGTENGELLSTYFNNTPFTDVSVAVNEHRQLGNYYNWTAAVATNNSTNVTTSTSYANSVCPKGWRLPVNGEYGTLNSNYNPGSGSGSTRDAGLFAAPLYLVRGGYVRQYSGLATLYNTGRGGYYWSSTTYSSGTTVAYNLYFRSSNVYPASNYNRNSARSLRCVAL